MPLPPNLEQRLAKRARKLAAREYNPQIRSLRTQSKQLSQARRREVRSIKGATNYASGLLTQQLKGLKAAGLKGRALKQTRNELVQRQGDLAQAVPLLTADASAAFRQEQQAVKQEILGTRQERAQTASEVFQDLAKERLEARAEKREDNREDRDLKLAALRRGENTLINWLGNPDDGVTSKGWKPLSEVDWRTLENEIAKGDGISDILAQREATRLRTVYEKLLEAGLTDEQINEQLANGGFWNRPLQPNPGGVSSGIGQSLLDPFKR